MKTYELNTNLIPMFSGTYESMWEPQEYADNGDEVYCDYKHEDLMRSIAKAYNNYSDNILRDLQEVAPFIKSLVFPGGFHSPREYNFATDTLDFTIEVDETAMIAELEKLRKSADFDAFLYDNYTSYDGFWSFTPNTWEGIHEAITEETDKQDQSMGALITFLARDVIKTGDFYSDIEGQVYDNWQGNGYGGLDYVAKCWECNNEVSYNYDFNCQNTDCKRYTKTEART